MAMRVFSPTQAKSDSQTRYDADLRRAKNLADLTQEILQAKAEAEQIFEDTLKSQREEMEQFLQTQAQQKAAVLKEVESLEERRKLALQPPLIRAEDIHSVEEALHARKLELDAREQEVDDQSYALMRRIDDITSREQNLVSQEKRVKNMELGAETQRNQVAKDSQRLSQHMQTFYAEMEERETQMAYRQSEIDASNNLLDEREKLLKERENEIQKAHRLLDDRRKLLDKGFDELTRLKLRYGSRN